MGAQGSQSGISVRPEVSWGELDPGQFEGVNFTEEDMTFAIENQSSNTVRPDRQTLDLVQVGAETSGGFTSELQYGNLDTIIEGFFWNNWVDTNITIGATLSNLDLDITTESGAGLGGTIVFGSSTSSTDLADLKPGFVVKITGASNSANNGIFRIKAKTDDYNYTLDSAMVTETMESGTFTGSNIINGVTKKSFSIERANYDINQYFLYTGMTGNTMEVSLESGSPVTVALSFVGKDEQLAQTQWGSSAPTDPPTTPVMNAVSSVAEILMDGVAVPECLLQSLSFSLDNQVEGKSAVGVLGNCDASGRSISLTGSASLYFQDETYYEKYLNSTSFSIVISLQDGNGNKSEFRLSKVKFDSATANVPGKDDDVMLDTSFVGILGDNGYTILLSKTT